MVKAVENRAAMAPLIEAGTNMDAEDENGRTPLMHAVGYGDLDLLRLLLEAGAGPNRKNRDRGTDLLIGGTADIDGQTQGQPDAPHVRCAAQ